MSNNDRKSRRPPPVQHRFRKGKSGNPKGRPTGAMGKKRIAREVSELTADVSLDGRIVRLPLIEALLHVLRLQVASGNARAEKLAASIYVKLRPQSLRSRGVLVVPETLTMAEWMERHGNKVPLHLAGTEFRLSE